MSPSPIAIVGVGETSPRFADTRPPSALALDAIRLALADAGVDAADVDGFVTEANSMPATAPADLIAQRLGVDDRRFSASLGLAGSGNVGAPILARAAIESGAADVVVCYYAINLSQRGAGGAYAFHAADPAKASFEMPFGLYGQATYFALAATLYADRYGLPAEHLAAVVGAARRHAARTPGALRPDALDLDGYMAEPLVAEPLRRADCCLVNDGGVAYVMTSLERARHLARPPVVVAGCATASKPVTQAQYFTQSADLTTTAAAVSGRRALAEAGVDIVDIDVAQVYDCFSISLMLQLEDLGLAPRGGAGELAVGGGLDLDASCPVNTHGGLLAHSYTVAANHVVEAVRQIRGERNEAQVVDAEVALVAGLGVPEHATLILTKDR